MLRDFRVGLGFVLAASLLWISSFPVAASTYENTFGEDVLLREIPFENGDPGPPIEGVPDLFPDVSAIGADLSYADLFEANLAGATLDDAILDYSSLDSAVFSNASLVGASLALTEAFETTMDGADFSTGNLEGFIADLASFSGADFTGANLTSAEFVESTLTLADFTDATLVGVDFFFSSIDGAIFANANLQEGFLDALDFSGVNLSGADLRGADLSDSTFLGDVIDDPPPSYDETTDFTGALQFGQDSDPFDPVAAGWTFVPEPSTSCLGIAAVALLGHLRRLRSVQR